MPGKILSGHLFEMNLYEELLARGAVAQITDDALIDQLNHHTLSFYLGIDPTGDSLHVGHLFGLINCRRLQLAGHKPVLLVGGATGMIGDPSGKSAERNLLDQAAIDANVAALANQIKSLIDAPLVNNYDWTSKYDVISFLRDIGKHFSINTMIAKESVKSRLDSGISFTEFSYQVLQALDYYHLYKDKQVTLQVGGTEQWGNITAGLDLIRRLLGSEAQAYGFCWDLITKSDGTKFGKTEQGAVWLDPNKTSPFAFYQFWLNTADDDAIRYLKKFTFVSLHEIEEIATQMQAAPEQRLAQQRLAEELTTMIHSAQATTDAKRVSEALFRQDYASLNVEELLAGFQDVAKCHVTSIPLLDALIELKLASSKSEARRFVESGGVTVNNQKVESIDMILDPSTALKGSFSIVRRGKKQYGIVLFDSSSK
jgi:tyrosyl-tRNA synthetase